MHRFPMPGGNGLGILFGIAGFVGTLVFIGLVIALVVYLVRRNKTVQPGHPGQPSHRPPMPPAVQVLDERLASGDIEIEDYLNRKAALLGDVPKPAEWTPTPAAPENPAPNGEDSSQG